MNNKKAMDLRVVVRHMDEVVSKSAAGVALGTYEPVLALCETLRAADLDATGAHCLSVIERSAEMLEGAGAVADRAPSFEERAQWEIELLKSVWRLDAHLRTLATVGGPDADIAAAA